VWCGAEVGDGENGKVNSSVSFLLVDKHAASYPRVLLALGLRVHIRKERKEFDILSQLRVR
jgi:hypothetical protein